MDTPVCLIVPSLMGCGDDHWHHELHRLLPNSKLIQGVDVTQPVVAAWADAIRQAVKRQAGSVILLAQGFGSLASVIALADREHKVLALILQSPVSPSDFSVTGRLGGTSNEASFQPSLEACMPTDGLNAPGVLIATQQALTMSFEQASFWANCWGLRLHVMTDQMLQSSRLHHVQEVIRYFTHDIRQRFSSMPLGGLEEDENSEKNRFSALIKARRLTRELIQ